MAPALAQLPLLAAALLAAPAAAKPAGTCPGELAVAGAPRSVSLVNARWNIAGDAAGKVEVGPDGGSIVTHMKGRTYFGSDCKDGTYNNTNYVAMRLLGKTLRYTVDMTGAGCGCNAAFYLTSLHQNDQASECEDHYCDANNVCGVSCVEIDIQEANQHAWHSTLHAATDHSGVGGGLGGGDGWDGPRDWSVSEYGPGASCIDTTRPVNVAASFPADGGRLQAMEIELSQEGTPCTLRLRLDQYDGMAELEKALAAGMTPIVSYWSADDMTWMDGQGADGQGPCSVDRASECSEHVVFYNFSVAAYGEAPPPAAAPATPAAPPTGAVASEPFDCDAGAANWEAGWSRHKKEWCCKHKEVGCEEEAAASARGAASAMCPGAFTMGGDDEVPVSLVNAKWNVAGERAGVVEAKGGNMVVPHMKGRTYFGTRCVDGSFSNEDYMALSLLGKTFRYTVDLAGAGCGCNVALYLTSLHQNDQASECEDYYCDANNVQIVPAPTEQVSESGATSVGSDESEGPFDNETSVFDRIMAARPSIQVPDLIAMLPNPLWASPGDGPLDLAVDPEDFVEISDPDNISAVPDDPRDDGFVQENQTSWMGGLAAMREVVWNRATCFGEDCKLALYDGATMVRGSASTGALAAWNAAMRSEGWIVYNLFRRQLAIFFPSFQRAAQIQADLFFERSFWLRNLTACPAAFSLLLPILPAGLNFTRCYISDVRVSWGVDPSALGKVPIAVDVETVRAAAAEVRAGSDEEVEDVITNWLEIAGGVDERGEARPFEFADKYPLLDGATFRCRKLELDISSPTRYGNITVSVQDLEVRAVDSSGQVQDLEQLCEDGRGELTQSFFRLYVCSEASVRYRRTDASEGPEQRSPQEPVEDASTFRTGAGDLAPEYMLYPTPLAALHSQVKSPEDLNLVLKERWQLSFPGPLSILTLPPFLSDAPPLPPRDRRLSRYEGPPAEWCVQVSKEAPLWGVQRSTPLQRRKRLWAPLALMAALLAGRALRRLLWPA